MAATAKAAEYFLADGIILTGNTTGDPTKIEDVCQVKKSTTLPIIVGSGVTLDNLQEYLDCDALIVGSNFKKDGNWKNDLEESRIKKFMDKIRLLL